MEKPKESLEEHYKTVKEHDGTVNAQNETPTEHIVRVQKGMEKKKVEYFRLMVKMVCGKGLSDKDAMDMKLMKVRSDQRKIQG